MNFVKINDEMNKVIIEAMNETEARMFVFFLKSEIARHKMAIDNAVDLIYSVCVRFKLGDLLEE